MLIADIRPAAKSGFFAEKNKTVKTDPKKEPVTAIAMRVSAHRLLSSAGSLGTLTPFVSEHVKKDKMDGEVLGKTITGKNDDKIKGVKMTSASMCWVWTG